MTKELGIKKIAFKDERGRMNLGSFKALGAAYVIAKNAYQKIGEKIKEPYLASKALKGETFVTASAGNHGLSVAAGAKIFGAEAVIYLSVSVPSGFARLRKIWGQDFKICTVEPTAAPAIKESIIKGRPIHTTGPVSNMGRLDCKAPSHAALKYLAKEADYLMTLEDDYVSKEIKKLMKYNLETSPSGGAGFAGLLYCIENKLLEINNESRVLIFISEGPSDD